MQACHWWCKVYFFQRKKNCANVISNWKSFSLIYELQFNGLDIATEYSPMFSSANQNFFLTQKEKCELRKIWKMPSTTRQWPRFTANLTTSHWNCWKGPSPKVYVVEGMDTVVYYSKISGLPFLILVHPGMYKDDVGRGAESRAWVEPLNQALITKYETLLVYFNNHWKKYPSSVTMVVNSK